MKRIHYDLVMDYINDFDPAVRRNRFIVQYIYLVTNVLSNVCNV